MATGGARISRPSLYPYDDRCALCEHRRGQQSLPLPTNGITVSELCSDILHYPYLCAAPLTYMDAPIFKAGVPSGTPLASTG
jgi:hypothetical protein